MALRTDDLRIKLFMDGADLDQMREAYREGRVQGFTTNPTLMRKAGVSNYEEFARAAIQAIPDLPLSFEVFTDDFDTMAKEARAIASWGGTTYIKVPITNTRGESAVRLIEKLASEGLRLNVTAVTLPDQVHAVAAVLNPQVPSIVSIFAGRIADTGVDPVPIVQGAVQMLSDNPKAEVLWASPREVFNLRQAEQCGCHILTATFEVLKKLDLFGRDLREYSLDTVRMFHADAQAAGYKII